MPSTWTWTKASVRTKLKQWWQGCSAAVPLQIFPQNKNADDSKARLLRIAGSAAQGDGEGYSHVVPQAGAEVSPGPESRRQILRRKIQTVAGSLRRALRFEEAADVRPVRLLQRKSSARRPRSERPGRTAGR